MPLSTKLRRPEAVLAEGEHEGFQWAIVHNGSGYRCGYVRIPEGHPWHNKDYDNIDANVHGGLTYASEDIAGDDGISDGSWWIGFDCAHGGDAPDPTLPTDYRIPAWPDDTIKTTEYVKAECLSLCEQAKAAITET